MTESNFDKFIKKEAEEIRKDKEKNSYLNQESFVTNRMLEENLQLIKEKGFKPGKKIWLTLVKIKGEIVGIRENERNSVVVKREDGKTFAYSPREMDSTE